MAASTAKLAQPHPIDRPRNTQERRGKEDQVKNIGELCRKEGYAEQREDAGSRQKERNVGRNLGRKRSNTLIVSRVAFAVRQILGDL